MYVAMQCTMDVSLYLFIHNWQPSLAACRVSLVSQWPGRAGHCFQYSAAANRSVNRKISAYTGLKNL
jgi:hypothetical protein